MPESSETEEEDSDFANLGTVKDEHSEDEEDCVDPAPRKKKKSSDPGCLFTDGCGFWSHDRSQLKTVVELAASKKKVGDDWQCDPTVFGLILRWDHKPSFNFAADVMNSNFVVAREINLESAFDLCRLRGWILTRLRNPKEASFCLEHSKRIHACLKEAGFSPNHHALQLKEVIEAHCGLAQQMRESGNSRGGWTMATRPLSHARMPSKRMWREADALFGRRHSERFLQRNERRG